MLVVLSSKIEVNLSVESPYLSTEQLDLLALKAHVVDDPQNLLGTNWSTTTSFCRWIGVTGESTHHRVTSLNLSAMGLKGTILLNFGFLLRSIFPVTTFMAHYPSICLICIG
ncbi:hypothetical protein DITRI_Ditri09bG0131400 [Diplodiscus trichospermus]